jgi:hypothetical protein
VAQKPTRVVGNLLNSKKCWLPQPGSFAIGSI